MFYHSHQKMGGFFSGSGIIKQGSPVKTSQPTHERRPRNAGPWVFSLSCRAIDPGKPALCGLFLRFHAPVCSDRAGTRDGRKAYKQPPGSPVLGARRLDATCVRVQRPETELIKSSHNVTSSLYAISRFASALAVFSSEAASLSSCAYSSSCFKYFVS